MLGFFTMQNCQTCRLSSPKHDTVRVSFGALSDKESDDPWATMEPERRAQVAQDEEAALVAQVAQEEELMEAAAALVAQVAQAGEDRRMQRLEEERLERVRLALQQQQKVEAERRAMEEQEAVKAEQLRLEEEEEQEQKDSAKVWSFLCSNGFSNINERKKTMMSSQYALHVAVKKVDADAVRALLTAGADASLKNSSGQTPLAQAEKSNKKNSHQDVISILRAT